MTTFKVHPSSLKGISQGQRTAMSDSAEWVISMLWNHVWPRQAEGILPCPWQGFEGEAFRLPPAANPPLPPLEVSGWPGQQWARLKRRRQGLEGVGEQLVVEAREDEAGPGSSSLLRKQKGAKKQSVSTGQVEEHRNVTRLCANAV